MVCRTWEATYGNGAKIGTMLECKTVCYVVRRGSVATPTLCLLRIAATAPLIFVTIMSGFVVL